MSALVVDAGALVKALLDRDDEDLRERLGQADDMAAPHVIDVEVLGIVRRQVLLGRLDPSAAELAVTDLGAWAGERFGHRAFLHRAWELRTNVRGWDAMYVALAEALSAPLLTTDRRLAAATGPRCRFEVL